MKYKENSLTAYLFSVANTEREQKVYFYKKISYFAIEITGIFKSLSHNISLLSIGLYSSEGK